MYIVTVIPLAKGLKKDTLTYFSAKEIPVGTLVTVTIRNKEVFGFVLEIASAELDKSTIKRADFKLQKIKKSHGVVPLPPGFFEATTLLAKYYVCSLSQLYNLLLPKPLLEILAKSKIDYGTHGDKPEIIRQEKLVLQAPFADRLSWYKSCIRESFARRESVFIAVPTIADGALLHESLSRGIEEFVYLLSSDLSKKEFDKNIKSIVTEEHPVLIIGTVPFIATPRRDLGTIIIERESSGSYRTIGAPYVDLALYAELFTNVQKERFILADTLLRVETFHRYSTHELGEVLPVTFRIPELAPLQILSTKRDESAPKKPFSVFSEVAEVSIRDALAAGEHIFLFTLRNGLATFTVCKTCGETVSCEHCTVPLVLIRESVSGKRSFLCPKCTRSSSATVTCKRCGSYNLLPLGIGVDTVMDECKKLFSPPAGGLPLFSLDAENMKNTTAIGNVIEKFQNSKGAILVGTERALPYIPKVDRSIVVSFDSLFLIPSYQVAMRIIRLVVTLRLSATKKCIIQTRNPDDELLKVDGANNLLAWYRSDIAQREALRYPPHTTIIKVSVLTPKDNLKTIRENLGEIFTEYEPDIFLGRGSPKEGYHLLSMILRVPIKMWSVIPSHQPDFELSRLLGALPREYMIEINPEQLF